MDHPLYQLVAAERHYEGHRALGPVDLAIAPGERLALIGPSGCGKSTLLKLLIGLVPPSAGQVLWKGAPLDAIEPVAWRRRLGYVIQEGGLFPHLTARDNVGLVARASGWSRERIAARIGELAALAGLAPERLRRYPNELSGGQRQRVSLMRALMLDPEVLLLDEPLGALDPMIRFRLQDDLAAIVQSLGKTVILVSHDLAEAVFLSDRIILLRDGRIEQQGPFAALRDDPASGFVRDFVRAQRGLGLSGRLG